MQIGDIVNIKETKHQPKFKGTVIQIISNNTRVHVYDGINYHKIIKISELVLKDNEYWEK